VQNDNSQIILLGHFKLGNALYLKNDLDSAIAEYRQSVSMVEREDRSLHGETLRIGYLGKRNKIYAKLSACFLRRFELSRSRADLEFGAPKYGHWLEEREPFRSETGCLVSKSSLCRAPGCRITIPASV